MEPRMELIGHWATGAGPLRQVLDQTAEFKEDSGIYDALGCQAGHVLATFFVVPWRIPQEVFPQLHNSGRGEAGHSVHALFGMVCSRISDWIVDRCGSLWEKMALLWRFLYVFVGNLGKYANRPTLALFELRTTTST